jgi:HlyD family secretion protein
MKGLIGAVLLVGLMGGGAGMWYWRNGTPPATTFRTTVVERGNLLATVTATGTLEPVEAIDVGAQVAGQIKAFGRDPQDSSKPIDFGAVVEEGTILAQLDDSVYVSQVGQARANVLRAEADLLQFRAKLNQSEREWNRVRRLTAKAISELEYDTAQNAYESAKAALQVGDAVLVQAKEALKQAETNLGYTTIRSPVKGVILDRRVNVGQTVVASLNAPSLFLIATDLSKLQIWASVNEADIGQVHAGQKVRFTVDAYPNEEFTGKVSQIRLNATMTMNVVTYTVVVDTDNGERRLLPYMTANLQFLVSERHNVLMVPNSALRWRPGRQYVAPEHRDEYDRVVRRKANTEGRPADNQRGQSHVWLVGDQNLVRPLKVRTGLTDGTMTEIVSGDLKEGDPVVIGATATPAPDNSVNPFSPVMPSKSR